MVQSCIALLLPAQYNHFFFHTNLNFYQQLSKYGNANSSQNSSSMFTVTILKSSFPAFLKVTPPSFSLSHSLGIANTLLPQFTENAIVPFSVPKQLAGIMH